MSGALYAAKMARDARKEREKAKKAPTSDCQSEIETKLGFLGTEISDLFQRYGHALDRIIRLEEKVRRLESTARNK